MGETSRRALTKGELALARESFGDRIDYEAVRVCDGPGANPAAWLARRNGNPAITLVNTIHILSDPVADFSQAGADTSLFMHEMTHIWQYDALGLPRFLLRYGREFAACGFEAAAMYSYEAGSTPFAAAMLEAQANMVCHYGDAVRRDDAAQVAQIGTNLAGSGLYGL